jgi:hypothetical protein
MLAPMSPHPLDVLLRDLAASGRDVTPDELERILEHFSTAVFSQQQRRAPVSVQGIVGARSDSLSIHWAQHVIIDQQWAPDVTMETYLHDLQNAAKAAIHLLVYTAPRGPVAGVFAPNTIPSDRLGPEALPYIYVVYGATYGTIVTGHQASGLASITLPRVVTWLR